MFVYVQWAKTIFLNINIARKSKSLLINLKFQSITKKYIINKMAYYPGSSYCGVGGWSYPIGCAGYYGRSCIC